VKRTNDTSILDASFREIRVFMSTYAPQRINMPVETNQQYGDLADAHTVQLAFAELIVAGHPHKLHVSRRPRVLVLNHLRLLPGR
jgi:hypothetical protein